MSNKSPQVAPFYFVSFLACIGAFMLLYMPTRYWRASLHHSLWVRVFRFLLIGCIIMIIIAMIGVSIYCFQVSQKSSEPVGWGVLLLICFLNIGALSACIYFIISTRFIYTKDIIHWITLFVLVSSALICCFKMTLG